MDVFSKDLLLVPVNHNNLHWCLAAVDLNSRSISYYDSMVGNGLSGEMLLHMHLRAVPANLMSSALNVRQVQYDDHKNLVMFLGHAEDRVLPTLERWLQQEWQDKKKTSQVSFLNDCCFCL